MINTQNDSSQRVADAWYMQACRNCFLNLERSNFVILFLAPVCLPNNINYGNTTRLPGRAPNSKKKSSDLIADQQEDLLDTFLNELKTCEKPSKKDVAARAKELADTLIKTNKLTPDDISSISKGNSCQANRYLPFFKPHCLLEENSVFNKLLNFYSQVVDLIFQELPVYYDNGITQKTKALYQIASDSQLGNLQLHRILPPTQKELAWLLCAELVLLACRETGNWQVAKDLQLISQLPTPVPSARKSKIHLPAPVFYNLCTMAIRSADTLESVSSMLNLIRQYGHDTPNPLLQEPLSALEKQITILVTKAAKDVPSNNLQKTIATLTELSKLQTGCDELLRFHTGAE